MSVSEPVRGFRAWVWRPRTRDMSRTSPAAERSDLPVAAPRVQGIEDSRRRRVRSRPVTRQTVNVSSLPVLVALSVALCHDDGPSPIVSLATPAAVLAEETPPQDRRDEPNRTPGVRSPVYDASATGFSPVSGAPERVRAPAVSSTRDTISIGVGGDTSFGRYLRDGSFRPYGRFADLEAFAPMLSAPDWTMLNLEAPLYGDVPPRIKKHGGLGHSLIFRSPPETAGWLKNIGVDALSTANNHVEDCGVEGRAETRRLLDSHALAFAGTSTSADPFEATLIPQGGRTIAFFAWSTKRNYGSIQPGRIPEDVAYVKFSELRAKAREYVTKTLATQPDALVVFSIHWGQEYTERPSSPQIRAARGLVEDGVDLVVGHHSHSLQPVEVWKDGLILYSLGNFFFDQPPGNNRGGAFVHASYVWKAGGWRVESLRATAIQPAGRSTPARPILEADEQAAKKLLSGFSARSSRPPYSTPVSLDGHEAIWTR